MKVNLSEGREFVIVWTKGNIDLYLKPIGNYDAAFRDLKDEDLRIVKGLWNHLNSKKRDPQSRYFHKAIDEVLKALDMILEERKK